MAPLSAGSRRIVVFTGDPNHAVRDGIAAIERALPGTQWLVLVHAPPKPVRVLLRNQWRNLKANGWRWLPYQAADAWARVARRAAAAPSPDVPGAELALDALQRRTAMRVLRPGDIHAAAALDAVRDFAPDLGLSIAAPILRRPLFALPRLGTINLHKGRLPHFRGMPPAFWELWHGERSVGCSVHVVDDRLDTGALVAEDRIERAPHATLRGLQLQLDTLGVRLMRDAAVAMLDGRAAPRAQPTGEGRTFRKPTLAQQAALRQRLAVPAPLVQRVRGALKDGAATSVRALHRGVGSRLLAPRLTVVLYHRVSDDARDNLTVGIEQFDRQIAWLAAHCRVLRIEDALRLEAVPRSDRPLVAVTFDDGYLDNHAHAAPILRRHGVPAAFFVSTGIVASERRFPHDVRRGNAPIPVLGWGELRELRDWGFTIGSHTVHHVDCAAEPEAVVRDELARSRDDLARELGIVDPIFAYPYGGRQHMTPERLQWVRDAGYSGCLSAYGGSNVGRVDRWNVLRRGVHWEYSDRAFQLRCLGLA